MELLELEGATLAALLILWVVLGYAAHRLIVWWREGRHVLPPLVVDDLDHLFSGHVQVTCSPSPFDASGCLRPYAEICVRDRYTAATAVYKQWPHKKADVTITRYGMRELHIKIEGDASRVEVQDRGSAPRVADPETQRKIQEFCQWLHRCGVKRGEIPQASP